MVSRKKIFPLFYCSYLLIYTFCEVLFVLSLINSHVLTIVSATRALPLAFPGPLPFPEGQRVDGMHYKTAYRCEGEEMTISCDVNEVIQVIRANYGRFSIAICNKHGYTDWSVNCMSPETKRVLQSECDGERMCTMPVSSEVFGDPCPNTRKYVEVHFACMPKVRTTTTKRPLPPWFLQSGAESLWNIPNSAKEERNIETDRLDKTTTEQDKFRQSQDIIPTLDTKSSLSIYSITAPSSAMLPEKSLDLESPLPKPTASQTNYSPSVTKQTDVFGEAHTHGRKPILVTGYPSSNRRQIEGEWVNDNSTNEDEMSRIPITTPHSTEKKNIPISRNRSNDGRVIETNKSIANKGTELNRKTISEEKIAIVLDLENLPNMFLNEYCKPVIRRGIRWNWTRFEENDIRPCPPGSSGLAQFTCDTTGDWSEYGPNLGSCKSSVISDLEDSVRKQKPENVIISRLARFFTTNQHMKYYGGDVDGAMSIIRTLTDRLQYLFQTESKPFPNKKPYVHDFFQNIIRSVSTLIGKQMIQGWVDLEHDRKLNLITNLFSTLDESAFLLADFLDSPEVLEETSSNIAMSIYVLDVQYIKQDTENKITFPFKPSTYILKQKVEQQYKNNESDGAANVKAEKSLDANRLSSFRKIFTTDETQKSNSITISWSALKRNMNHKGLGKAVFYSYKHMKNIFKAQTSTFASSSVNSLENSDVLLSDIISASLGRGHNEELEHPVVINFRHSQNSSYMNPFGFPVCVSWNAEIDSWSETGCHLLTTNTTTSICECTHLGSFALLLRNQTSNSPLMSDGVVKSSENISSHILIAEVITYIAVALSIILVVIILFKYRDPIAKVMSKYNGLWCDRIRPSCTKNESIEDTNAVKNSTMSAIQNGNLQPTLRVDKAASFYPNTGFNNSSFHQIQQQNGGIISSYNTNAGMSIDHKVPSQNYKLSTLAHPVKFPQYATSQPQHSLSLFQQNDVQTRTRTQTEIERDYSTMMNQQRRPIATSYLTLLGPNDQIQHLDAEGRLIQMKQPVHSKYINVTMNPYNMRNDVVVSQNLENDGMLATQYLRDSVYMNPKLMQLTNTLRRGKKVCQGGHSPDERIGNSLAQSIDTDANTDHSLQPHMNDSTMLPESEVVFRAVSPHGHVYWEIDPTRSQTIDASKSNSNSYHNQNSTTGSSCVSESIPTHIIASQLNERVAEGRVNLQSARRSSDSPYDESNSAMDSSDARPTILVNPFADINMIAQCQSPSKSSTCTNITTDGSSLNVSPAQMRNIKSFSRFNSPRSKSKSADKSKILNNCRNEDEQPITSKINSTNPAVINSKQQEATSYAFNSVSSSSTSTTSASSSLSTPSKPNDNESTQRSIPMMKDVKMSIPPVSLRGKDFIMSKIQSHMVNGASGIKVQNVDPTSLADNMDSFLSSLAGSKRKKV